MAKQETASQEPTVEVRAKVDHTQPGTHIYRAKGDRFPHAGKLYEHVEPVSRAPQGDEPATE